MHKCDEELQIVIKRRYPQFLEVSGIDIPETCVARTLILHILIRSHASAKRSCQWTLLKISWPTDPAQNQNRFRNCGILSGSSLFPERLRQYLCAMISSNWHSTFLEIMIVVIVLWNLSWRIVRGPSLLARTRSSTNSCPGKRCQRCQLLE
jgi:hypothetical protein